MERNTQLAVKRGFAWAATVFALISGVFSFMAIASPDFASVASAVFCWVWTLVLLRLAADR